MIGTAAAAAVETDPPSSAPASCVTANTGYNGDGGGSGGARGGAAPSGVLAAQRRIRLNAVAALAAHAAAGCGASDVMACVEESWAATWYHLVFALEKCGTGMPALTDRHNTLNAAVWTLRRKLGLRG